MDNEYDIQCPQCLETFEHGQGFAAVPDANGEAHCSNDCAHESNFDIARDQPVSK